MMEEKEEWCYYSNLPSPKSYEKPQDENINEDMESNG